MKKLMTAFLLFFAISAHAEIKNIQTTMNVSKCAPTAPGVTSCGTALKETQTGVVQVVNDVFPNFKQHFQHDGYNFAVELNVGSGYPTPETYTIEAYVYVTRFSDGSTVGFGRTYLKLPNGLPEGLQINLQFPEFMENSNQYWGQTEILFN